MQFSVATFYLSVLVQNMFLNTLFPTILCLSLPWYERPNVTPVLNSGQNYNFVFFNLYVLDRKREDKILDHTVVCIPLLHNLNPRLWKKIYNYKLWRAHRVLELLRMILVFSFKNIGYCMTEWPASWSSSQSLWLLIMRSRVRFPALPWEFSLKGEDFHGRPNLRSRLHFCHAQEGGPRSPQGHVVAMDPPPTPKKKDWM